MEENDLAIDVFDKDPESFGASMNFLFPLEVGSDGEFNAEK